MLNFKKQLLVVVISSLSALTACNKREAPAQVNADVAQAQANKSENVGEAMKDQATVAAKTSADATSRDPDDRGSALKKRADAAYDVATAKAEGDMKIAVQGCEALPSKSQAACTQKAHGAYEVTKAQAKADRDNANAQGNAVKKLDN